MKIRRTTHVALVVATALIIASCGGSGAESESTEAPDATEAPSSTDESTGNSNGQITVDTEVIDEDPWNTTAGEFGLEVGKSGTHECPADGTPSQLWGTGPFTDDSSLCTAAVFVGAITVEDGGTVNFTIVEPTTSYDGGEANGVIANEYGEWPGAFSIDTN